ncbi:MAG: sigma-70 family RNA polymerase sigma factor [Gemmataceae bacterium]|nr:sigma-70 family RNA polymerase sigma factor [Gemmataceae bacterium]
MPDQPLQLLIRNLRRLNDSAGGGLTDAQLLERFVKNRDEAAFEVLLWRHGPMVLGLCRRLLRQPADIEDSFQATFLALVRKAGSISKRESAGSWLYKVAYRVALAARGNGQHAQQTLVDLPAAEPVPELVWRDLQPVLDEEIMGLPEKYRAAFVLCCLEGKTNEEAARQLGCPKGTLLSRLSRARELLRHRLSRRGVALSVGACASLGHECLAAVPDALASATLHLLPEAAQVSTHVITLTEGALRAMVISKLKIASAACVVALALAGMSVGLYGSATLPGDSVAQTAPDAKAGGAAGRTAAPVQAPPVGEGGEGAVGGATQPQLPGGDDPGGAGDLGGSTPKPLDWANLRARSQAKLKQIGIALHNYHDTFTYLPAPAIYSKTGKPLLSWRVALLPFLEQDNLFRQFKLDEPWDSPHNKTLLPSIPEVYAPVIATKPGFRTYYQALVGARAAMEPNKSFKMHHFPDGTSNTVAVVEGADPVPWTKPDDVPFAHDQPLPKLGGQFQGDFHALLLDGQVQLFSKNADADMLRKCFVRDDGHVVDLKKVLAPSLEGALAAAKDHLAAAKRELEAVKSELTEKPADAAQRRLLRENIQLQETLLQTLQELSAVRSENARLQEELRNLRK